MPKQTSVATVLLRRTLMAVLLGLCLVSVLQFTNLSNKFNQPVKVEAATADTVNFQARLLNSSGAIVPDGNYHVEFKLYDVSSGGTALWTETRSTGNLVRVVNGYLTVNLGSVTSFPTINWDKNLWLTMNIGGSGGSPSWDGEMTPRLKLTSVPYAFAARKLIHDAGSGNDTTLDFASPSGSNTITLPAASGTVCLQNASACGFATGSGAAFLQGGNSFGSAATLGTNDNFGLNFETNGTTVASLSNTGAAIFQNASDSATAFQVKDLGGTSLLTVDTTNSKVIIGTLETNTITPSGAMTIGSTTQQFTLQGSDTSTITATGGGFTTTVGFSGVAGANVTYNFDRSGGAGTYTICTTIGNCAGTGGGVTTPGGTAGRLAKFTAGSNIADSIIAENAGVITVNGDAIINGSGGLTIGDASTLGVLNLFDGTSGFKATLEPTTLTADRTLTIPDEDGTLCVQGSTNCGFLLGSGDAFLQNGNSFGATAVLGTNDGNALTFETNNQTQATISVGGATTFKNSSNSTTAFTIQSANVNNLLNIDTSTSANVLTNGDFEQGGTPGWSTRGSSSLARTTSHQVQGNAALSILTAADNDGTQYNYALGASTTYTLSFYAKVSSGSITSFEYGHSDDTGASDTNCQTGQTLTSGWKRFTCTFTMGGSVSGTRYLYFIDTSGSTPHTIYLDAVQLETGGTATAFTAGGALQFGGVINSPLAIKPLQDSSQVLQVQTAAGNQVLSVNTLNGNVVLGQANAQAGILVFNDGASANSVTLQTDTLTSSYTLNFPDASPGTYDVCTTAGNCSGTADTLQTVYNTSLGGTTPEIKLDSTRGAIDIQDANSTIGANLFNIRASNGSGLGQIMFGVGNTGAVILQNSANSNAAFQIKNAAGNNILTVDTTTNGQLILGDPNILSGTLTFAGSGGSNLVQLQGPSNPGANRSISLPDENGTLCIQSSINCGFILNQNSSAQTANFIISGNGTAASFLTPLLDTPSGTTTLNIGTNNATAGISLNQNVSVATNKNLSFASGGGNFDQSASSGTFQTGTGNVTLNGNTSVAAGKNLSFVSGAGNFDQSASSGTFKTGTGAVTFNGDSTVAAGKNLTLASGGGVFTQTFTGVGDAHTITANSLTSGTALKVTSSNNTGSNTAWNGLQFNMTNAQGSTAVSGANLIAGANFNFTQNTAITGNNETVANFSIAQNNSASSDSVVGSIINVANNDTATGNQITATDGIHIEGANIDNGINLSGSFGTNLITANNFVLTAGGAITTGSYQGTAIADTYIQDNLTINSSGTVDWTALNNYPAACSAGQAVTALGDTITCTTFAQGTFLAKNAVDTSTAAVTASNYLYSFTNSSSAVASGVLSLNNGNNTGNTLSATTSGNPGAGNAVIFASNTNTSPSGNLLDLQSGSSPTSKFSVDASGNVLAAGTYNTNTFNSNTLTFGGASATSISSASGQALNLTGNAASTFATSAGNLTIQAGSGTVSLGTSTNLTASGALTVISGGANSLTLDTGGAATLNVGTTNANAISVSKSGVTTTINGALTVAEAASFTGSGTGLAVTNDATVGGTFGVTGTTTLSGNLLANGNTTIGNATSDRVTVNSQVLNFTGNNFLSLQGATDNGFTTTLALVDPTANNVITVPNASGTFAVSASGNIALSAAGDISFTGLLPIVNGGTNASTAGGARLNLGAAASGANSDITSLSGLTTALSVGQGGTGATSFTANGILFGNGSGAVQVTAAGTTGQCLTGNTGSAPTFAACNSFTSLQNAYNNGNTISTSGNDVAITLNGSDDFTVTTAAGATGSSVFSLADGANTTPPAQLILVKNNDTDEIVPAGISVQSAAGTITTAFDASGANITNALSIGANAIAGTNFSVTGAGAITAVGVNAGTGQIQGTGGLNIGGGATITGTTNINTTGTAATSIGNSTGTLTVTGSSSSTFVLNGVTVDATEFNRLDGKDAALVDTNDAVNTAITGTGALNAGSITFGFGSIDTGADNITTTGTLQGSTSILTALVDTVGAGTLAFGTNNATAISLNQDTTISGSHTFTSGTGAISLQGATTLSSSFSQTGANTFSTGTGAVTLNGNTTISGSNTFTSGTGDVLLQGNTDVANTASLATKVGSTFTTAGTSNNAALNVASFYLMDTSGAAQVLNGISAGRDGQILTLTNVDASNSVTLSNNSGSATGSKIITGSGGDLTLPVGGSVNLIYDNANSFWRVVGTTATSGGYANTALSNLTATSINQSLNPNADNTLDLGSAANSWRTLYADTSIFTPVVDTAAAGSLSLGDTNATSISICNSAACDTVSIATNGDADTVDVGDANDTINLTGTLNVTGTSTFAGNISQTGTSTFSTGTGAITLNGATTLGASFSQTGANTFSTGTGAVSLNGNTTVTGSNTFTSGSGAVSLLGATTLSNTFTQTGANAFSTGTGAVTLNGATSVSGSNNFTVGTGTTALGGVLNVTGLGTFSGGLTVATGSTFENASSTLFTAVAVSDVSSGGDIGTAASTVDVATTFDVNQTTASQVLTLPTPTVSTSGRIVYVNNVGSTSFSMYSYPIAPGASRTYIWNGSAWTATDTDVAPGGAGVNAIGIIDSQTKSSDGAVIVGTTLYMQTADASNVGLVGTSAQTFAGAKTFNALLTASGGVTITGTANINSSGTANTSIGNSTGTLTYTGSSSSTFVLNGVTVDTSEFNLLDGKDAALVDVNDAVTTAITGTGALNAGSITSGFGSIDTGADNITTTGTLQGSTSVLTALVDTVGAGVLALGTNNATAINLNQNTTISGSHTFTTGTGAVSLQGATTLSSTFSQTGANTFSTGTGAVSLNGATTVTGSNTFTSGTGTVTLQGNTDIANTVSLATKAGTTFTTAGTSNNAALNVASLYLMDTSGAAQVLNGITAGRDGQILTLTNIDASNAVTLSNNSGSATGSKIITGTGADVSLAVGASITLIYDSANSFWRVVGSTAVSGGYANTALSNLSSTSINQSLNPNADNTLDLGSAANSWRTLYADTNVFTPSVDTASAGALSIGNTNATSVSLCNSTACDTISIGTNADADTITIGDSTDTVGLNGSLTVTGTTSINTSGTANTSIGNATGTLTVTGSSSSTFVLNGTTIDATEFNRLDGKDAALVDVNDAVNTAITGTGALNSGSITSGFGSIDTGADNITTTGTLQGSTSVLTALVDTVGAGTLALGTNNATAINLNQNTTISGSHTFTTGTGAVSLQGATTLSSTFSQTGANIFSTGTGAVSLNGATTVTGSNTFTSGTGDVLLQGNTDIANTVSLATRVGSTFTTAGTSNNAALNVASFYLLDTSGAAQVINGITAGRDGQLLTLTNVDASNVVTLANNSGSATGSKIITGSGSDMTLPVGASVSLIYDNANSFWRVVGTTATSGGYANTALSNLTATSINQSLSPNADNTLDLGSSGNSWRSLYADTSVLTPVVDTAAAGALSIGNTNATSVSICNSATCDIISIGSNADADTITVGDSNDTVGINGALTVTGTTSINTSGTAGTSIGNSTGTLTVTGSSSSTFVVNGVTVDATEFNRLDGKDAALVDVNDAVNTAITGTGALNQGSITSGFGSIDTGADNITTTGTVQGSTAVLSALIDTVGAGTLALGTNNATAISLNQNTTISGSHTFTTGTGAISLQGATTLSSTFSQTGANTFSTGTGAVSLNGATTVTGSNTFTSGTGTVTLQGNTDIANTVSLATKAGTTFTTAGTSNNAALNVASFYLLDTSGAAQVINGITAGRDGQIVTLTNVDASNAVTLANNSGSATGSKIITGSGADATLAVGASITLIYDSANSVWRVIGDAAAVGGYANTALSNLTTTSINQSLNPNADNTLDLGSSANSWRTLYADTNVFTPSVDTAAAGALAIGNTNATSVSLCNSAACDTITIGSNADADTITVGDSSDTVGLNGTLTVTGATSINTSGTAGTSIGNSTGTITVTGSSSSTFVLNGTTVDATEFNRLDGKDATLVDTNDAVNTAITGTGALGAGSITSGFGSIDTGADNITTTGTLQGSTSVLTALVDTVGAGTLALGTNNATAINLNQNTTISGSHTFTTGTGAVSLQGATTLSSTFSQTGANTFSTGTGAVSLNGATTVTGSNTFTSGTGAVTLQGNTDIANTVSLATKVGSTFTTAGTSNNAALNVASFYLLDTSGAAQVINGITAGRDGQILTLTNVDASNAVTLSNNSGSATGSKIITGTGSDVSLGVGASVTLIYDAANSVWRTVGSTAGSGGYANTALSNLTATSINQSLNPNADNTLDLGSAANSWRTLYADTNIFTPSVDTAAAGALSIGNTNATSVSLCNSAACDTITIGSNADADTITIGDSTDTIGLNGALTVTGTTSINTSGTAGTSIGNSTGTLTVTGSSSSTFVLNGVTVDATEFNRLDGKDAALVDTNDAVNTAITGTGALNSGSITNGFGSIDTGADNITTTGTVQGSTSVLTALVDTVGAGTLALGTNNATAINLNQNTTISGSHTFTTGTGAVSLQGATTLSSTFSQTGANTFSTGTGAVSLNGATTVTGSNTFTSGTGTVTLQGNTDIANTVSLATKAGTTFTTAGTSNNAALNVASLYLLDTSGAAQVINGITAGRDGQILTLINVDATNAVTLSNNSGSATGSKIITGTGVDASLPVGSSITLIYDAANTVWRVIGSAAQTGGSANQALSNLTATSINQSLNPNADNTLDLGSSGNSWRTLYADTSVLTPIVDTAAAGALSIGNTNATSVSLCNSAACDTITIGNNSDADTITVGDSNDTIGLNGALTVTGTASINTSGTAGTSIGNSTGTLTVTGSSSSTFVLNGVTVDATEFNRLDGKDAALVDTNDAVNTAITGTGALGSGSITSGFGSIDTGADNITTTGTVQGSTSVLTALVDTVGAGTLALGTNNATAINLNQNTTISGSHTFTTGTGAISLQGATTLSSTFSQTGANTFSTGTGAVSLNGATSVTGSNTFTSGTGTVTLQGNTDIANTVSLATKVGSTFTTAGTSNNAALNVASFYLMDTSGAAQVLNGISAGRDGQILTLTNVDASNAVTLSNNSGSATGSKIITGTGSDVSLGVGASVTLIYDAANTVWRTVGSTAGTGGYANTALSNLTATSINQSLNPNVDNTLDLGSSANSWRTLYADTSVLTPSVDTAAAGALTIGNTNATSVSICNSAACDTITIGSNADADTITVGDSNDTVGINGTLTVTGTTSINTSGTAGTSIGNATGTLTVTGSSSSTFVLNGTTLTAAEINLLDGHGDSGSTLVDTNDAVNTAITGTGALNSGSITSGFGSIDTGADDITTTGTIQGSTSVLTALVDTASSGALNIGTTNATSISLNKNTSISGSHTLTSGTGTVLLQGNTDIANTVSFATKVGSTFTTAGTSTSAALNVASFYLLDTSGAAQVIQGIAAGRDGQRVTLTNIDASNTVTLANNNGSGSAKIITGTGSDVTLPVGASIELVYDSANTFWRVVGSTAASGGYANQALSNLTATSINQSLNPNADNSLDLGSAANSWRTLYADTTVLTPNVDVATAGALGIGNSTATSVSICNSTACDTITIGSNADADTITVGDSTDTVGINGATTITGATTVAGTFSQTGANTFSTGTGAVSLNGDVTVASTKTLTMARNGTGSSDYTLGLTGTPVADSNSAQLRLGNALSGGNSVANGGTYIGINAPGSGAGSAADFVDFQGGGSVKFQVSSAGNITASGTYNTNTFGSTGLQFGGAGTATIQSAATRALNITGHAASTFSTDSGDLTIQAGSGTVSLGSTTTLTSNGALTVSSGSGALSLTSGTGAVTLTGANNIVAIGGTNPTIQSTGTNTLTLDTGGAAALHIGTTNATVIDLDQNVAITGSKTLNVGGSTTLTGTLAANGNVALGDASGDRTTFNGQISNVSGDNFMVLQGATNDLNTLTLAVTDPTNTRTVTFGDESGTVCLQNSTNCGFTLGSGTAFLQGGNTFSGTTDGDLGTNNNGNLNFRTNGTTKLTLSTGGNLTFASGGGNFDQSASTGTFKTGTGAVSLQGDTTISAGKSLTMTNGTGAFVQTYSGATTPSGAAHVINANSLSTGVALQVNSTNNSANNTAWNGLQFNMTNAQATNAVASGSIFGADFEFNQNASVAGNNESAVNIALALNNSSTADQTVNSLLNLANNDTATGNQITVSDGIRINGSNVNNGINFNGTFGSNYITASNFSVTNAGVTTSATSVLTPLLDAATAATTLNIGTTNANLISLKQNVEVASGKNFTMLNGTGLFTQNYSGSTTGGAGSGATTINANSLSTGTALVVNSTNNSANNTAWNGLQFNMTNAQATNAVAIGSIYGADFEFNQNTAIAGNTESVANFAVKSNTSASTDQTVSSILNLANNDTATGNQITVTDGIKINGANVTNGINFSGTFGTNYITSSNFTVANTGDTTIANGGHLAVGASATIQSQKIVNVVETFDSSDNCVFGCYGVSSDVTATAPSIPNKAVGYLSKVSTGAASFLLAEADGMLIQNGSVGAGSGITNNIGLRIDNLTSGSNDYGIYLGGADTADIIFETDRTHVLKVQDQDSPATTGSALQITGANGNTSGNGGDISITSGNGGGTGITNAGTITINNGTVSSTGTATINIGTSNTTALNLGNGSGGSAVTVQCGTGTCGFGNNATDHSTVLGSSTGASATTIQGGTAGIALNQNTTVAATRTLTVTSGSTTLTGATTGDALTVSNSTSAGNIAVFKDNSTTVLTIADGGSALFKPSTDSTSAFQVQPASSSTPAFCVDTTNSRIGVGTCTTTESITTTGAITLGNTSGTTAGTVRFNGLDFEGYDGSQWKSMTTQFLSVNPSISVRKNVEECVDSNGGCGDNTGSTLQDDDELFFSIGANETWNFRFVVFLTSGSTADFKTTIGTSASYSACSFGFGNAEAGDAQSDVNCGTASAVVDGSGQSDIIEIVGTIVNNGSPNTVTLRWAQFSSNTQDTRVHDGSYLQANRIVQNGDATLDAVLDNGNSFGQAADIGTNDAFDLNLRVAGNTVATFDNTDGSLLLKNTTNSSTAFDVQNSSGSSLFTVDTANSALTVSGDLIQLNNGVNALGDSGSMIPNSGFEVNNDGTASTADGWTFAQSVATATPSVTTTSPGQGAQSQQMAMSGTTAQGEFTSQCMPISASQTYSLSLRFKGTSASTNALDTFLDTYTNKTNCTNSSSVTTVNGTANQAATTSWAAITANTAANTTATWARVRIRLGSAGTATNLFIDGVRLTPSALTSGVDLAENYPANPADNLIAGELVSLGDATAEGDAFAVRSSAAYDSKLLGIISTQPGLTLDDGKGYDHVSVALAGRVPVKVNSENGAIYPGDPLTASSTPGVAMKATAAGKIVGYAVTGFEGPGDGVVVTTVNPSFWAPASSQLLQATAAQFGSLQVSGTATLAQLNVGGVATINNLTVTGTATIQTLKVSGVAEFSGDIRLSGRVNTRQAITKVFKAAGAINAGQVVVIDDTQDGYVKTTTTAGDNKVIGVAVQTVANAGDDVEVAISGSVQVQFDANLVVKPGAIVTTGQVLGEATTTTNVTSGTVLGKTTSTKDASNLAWMLITLQ